VQADVCAGDVRAARKSIHVSLGAARPSVTGSRRCRPSSARSHPWMFAASPGRSSAEGPAHEIFTWITAATRTATSALGAIRHPERGAKNIARRNHHQGRCALKELQPATSRRGLQGQGQLRARICDLRRQPRRRGHRVGAPGRRNGESQHRTFQIKQAGPSRARREAFTMRSPRWRAGIADWAVTVR